MVLDAANNLATAYLALGEYDQAVPLLKETLKRSRATRGEDDLKTLGVVNNLAQGLCAIGRPKEAIILLQPMLDRSREILGDDHPNTLTHMNNLAARTRQSAKMTMPSGSTRIPCD